MLDGTPLLDVKPWVAPTDLPTGRTVAPPVRCGWFDDVSFDRARGHFPFNCDREGWLTRRPQPGQRVVSRSR